jgi:hypothetical protein
MKPSGWALPPTCVAAKPSGSNAEVTASSNSVGSVSAAAVVKRAMTSRGGAYGASGCGSGRSSAGGCCGSGGRVLHDLRMQAACDHLLDVCFERRVDVLLPFVAR